MFGTEENKNILSFSSIWMADGTFKVVPLLFGQLYTVHALVGGVYPFRDGHLLPCKSSFFTEGCGIVSNACVQTPTQITFLVDFEQGAINTFREVWPMTYIKACFFHLSQSVYRKVQEVGLQNRYLNDTDFGLICRMLPYLAYLPPQYVVTAFEQLKFFFSPYPLYRAEFDCLGAQIFSIGVPYVTDVHLGPNF